jgi:hypothetical protein
VTFTKRLLLLACMILVSGCSTHERKFESDVPPPPVHADQNSSQAADAATILIQRYQPKAIALPTESLAALAQAAALLFEGNGAPGMRAAARRFADTLLQGRVATRSGQAFFGSTSRGNPDLQATTDAANALIEVFRATGDERYFHVAQSAARAVRSMGWSATKTGFAVRMPGTKRLYSIPLTADVALLLKRMSSLGGSAGSAREAKGGFHFIAVHQAAVGRWYLNDGAKTPMTLDTWARTLLALASTRSIENQGIVGGGAAGLWTAAFTSAGVLRRSPLADKRGIGLAMSLRLFQRFAGTSRDADLAFGPVLDDRRSDGTAKEGRGNDAVVQSYYALAFAERALALRRPTEWGRLLL